MLKVGDRVRSRGLHSNAYGAGKVVDIQLNTATVVFNLDGRTESFNVQMLRKV